MIDLHSHTTASDGTDSPAQLIRLAQQTGLRTLAITDHDTFAGYETATSLAGEAGVDLVCGVELSCRHGAKNIHLLAYFPGREAAPDRFQSWVRDILHSRRARNEQLIRKLQSLGFAITLEEVEAHGKTITGRPHFARVLVDKGYARDHGDAFDRLIGEEGRAFVERLGPTLFEALAEIKASGGVSSLAHPVRIGLFRNPEAELALFAELREAGLHALEVYHSDHTSNLVDRYREFAALLGLLETGGSDYHGENKPGIALGSVSVPASVMAGLLSTLNHSR